MAIGHKSLQRAMKLQVTPPRGGPVTGMEVLRREVQHRISLKRFKIPTALS